jgi:hypothetical protein
MLANCRSDLHPLLIYWRQLVGSRALHVGWWLAGYKFSLPRVQHEVIDGIILAPKGAGFAGVHGGPFEGGSDGKEEDGYGR